MMYLLQFHHTDDAMTQAILSSGTSLLVLVHTCTCCPSPAILSAAALSSLPRAALPSGAVFRVLCRLRSDKPTSCLRFGLWLRQRTIISASRANLNVTSTSSSFPYRHLTAVSIRQSLTHPRTGGLECCCSNVVYQEEPLRIPLPLPLP